MAEETVARSQPPPGSGLTGEEAGKKRAEDGDGKELGEVPRDGLRRCSVGALVLLKRAVARLEALRGVEGAEMTAGGV